MDKFIIAVHKQDINRWLDLTARAPLEEEVLAPDWYLFTVRAEDLQDAAERAQAKWRSSKLLGR